MNELTPIVNVDLTPVFVGILAYLGMLFVISGALQVIIAKLTVPILEPIKKALTLDDKGYQVELDVTMFILALVVILFTPAFGLLKNALAPALALSPVGIPDFTIAAMSVLWLVAGQDLIKGAITNATLARDAWGEIMAIDPTADDPHRLDR